MADLEANDIVVSILNGDQDAALVNIGQAIDNRIKGGDVRVRWWLHFQDRYVTADTFTIGAALSFEAQTSVPWGKEEPARSMTQRAALVVAHLIEVEGMTTKDAFDMLKQHSADAITFGEYAQADPPKDGGSPAT